MKITGLDVQQLSINSFQNIILHPVLFFKDLQFRTITSRKLFYAHLCKVCFLQYHCDIYHFGYSGTAITYFSVFHSLPGKIIISCLGTAENVKSITEPGRIKKLYSLFKAADKIHCVSGSMAELVKKYGAAQSKTFINRPAVDTRFFLRGSVYRENEKINILSVGRLIFQKGLMIGLMAIKELVKHYPNFTWTIVGDGPEEEELEFYIDLLGLQSNVILAGKKSRNEVFELYGESDIFFLPSVSEGIANVVLEAMSMELPVVSSDTGGMEELITHNKDGIICKNYDYKGMAKELQLLCNCFDQRLLLGQAGRKTIEEKFCIKRYIDIFENEYRQLLA